MNWWNKTKYRFMRIRLWWDSLMRLNIWQVEAAEKIAAVEESQRELLKELPHIAKLADMVNDRELARSQLALSIAEMGADTQLTVDEIQEQIQNQRNLKLGLEGSPAIGTREIRNKNAELVQVNDELARLHILLKRASLNGSDTDVSGG